MKYLRIVNIGLLTMIVLTACSQVDMEELDALTDLTAHLYCLYLEASIDGTEESIDAIVATTPQIILDFGFTEEEFSELLDTYEYTDEYEAMIIQKVPEICPQEYNYMMEI